MSFEGTADDELEIRDRSEIERALADDAGEIHREDERLADADEREARDRSEIERALSAFGSEGGYKLAKGARALIRGFRLDPARHGHEDLLYASLARTLMGDRTWKDGVDFDYHLRQTMRSIGSSWRKRASKEARAGAREVRFSELWPADGKADPKDLPEPLQKFLASPLPDPEKILITRERLAAVLSALADDRPARAVIGCWAEGLNGPEIEERLAITPRQYKTTAERIRRVAHRTEAGDWI